MCEVGIIWSPCVPPEDRDIERRLRRHATGEEESVRSGPWRRLVHGGCARIGEAALLGLPLGLAIGHKFGWCHIQTLATGEDLWQVLPPWVLAGFVVFSTHGLADSLARRCALAARKDERVPWKAVGGGIMGAVQGIVLTLVVSAVVLAEAYIWREVNAFYADDVVKGLLAPFVLAASVPIGLLIGGRFRHCSWEVGAAIQYAELVGHPAVAAATLLTVDWHGVVAKRARLETQLAGIEQELERIEAIEAEEEALMSETFASLAAAEKHLFADLCGTIRRHLGGQNAASPSPTVASESARGPVQRVLWWLGR